MKRKVGSRKYPFYGGIPHKPGTRWLFLRLSGVFLVRKEGFPGRKLLER